MVAKVTLILLGLVALSAAAGYRNRQTQFIQVSGPETTKVEVDTEEEPVYKQAVKVEIPQAAPIRVAYRQPESHNYASVSSLRADNERITEEQNKNAKYTFASAVDDGIQDQSQVRQETRDGQNVQGSYSYSDGFYKHTVEYVADENGYRVVKNEKELIGDGSGPQVDLLNGKADVHSNFDGLVSQYSVTAEDLAVAMANREADMKKTKTKVSAY